MTDKKVNSEELGKHAHGTPTPAFRHTDFTCTPTPDFRLRIVSRSHILRAKTVKREEPQWEGPTKQDTSS